MELSKNEMKILKVLAKNANYSYRQIAKETRLSPSTVMKNVEKLKKEEIIKAQISLVDYEKLGYDVQVIIQLKVSKGKLFEVEGKIASDRHVFAIYDQTGQYDAAILARFKTRRELDGFLKKIQTFPFIEDTETSLVLNVMKENPVSVFE
ncbi:AsnC family transcriptional regulator [Candidatus Micrarchaeota archaeon CG11_big_fil_rev_8_21_14_0_20_47_5]|nr:MAG: AsnC family transcriptional regulator [Candidatus Micrarchaeota archaeon CG11_big_fil_rev_8_21_14_0_20_47_5]